VLGLGGDDQPLKMGHLILFLIIGFWQAVAHAQPPVSLIEQAFAIDARAQFSVEELEDVAFQPYEGNLRRGFQDGVIWIRLNIGDTGDGVKPESQQRVLRVGPNNLERIELYVQSQGQWRQQVRGALVPQNSRDCPDDLHCFFLGEQFSETSTLYLRIAHPGFLLTQIEVLSLEALPQAVAKRTRGLTASLVVALALLVFALALLLGDRSALLLVYCGFQTSVILFIASYNGVLAAALPHVSGETLNACNYFFYVLRVAMSGALAWTVLRPHQTSRLFHIGGLSVLVVCVINAILIFLGEVQLGLKSSLLLISLIPVWYLYGTLTAKSISTTLRLVLFAGACVYLIMLAMGLLLAFGTPAVALDSGLIKQIADWRLNGFVVGLLFFAVTMMERSRQKRAKAEELVVLRHQAMDAQARQAELDDRSKLIDMLTHELKNPLSTIRFALASLRRSVMGTSELKRIQSIDLSARRMDGLIERVASFSKLERTALPSSAAPVDIAAMLQELLTDVADPDQWEVHVQKGAALRSDKQMLWAILDNLISNAGKYSLPGHKIRIGAWVAEDVSVSGGTEKAEKVPVVNIEVSNHVAFDALPEASRLFKRFYRHTNVLDKDGMGLGLSVAKSAAEKIGASIAYRQDRGQVFFTLTVPT
jgi:two-component system, sensor histidine kinase LadS